MSLDKRIQKPLGNINNNSLSALDVFPWNLSLSHKLQSEKMKHEAKIYIGWTYIQYVQPRG